MVRFLTTTVQKIDSLSVLWEARAKKVRAIMIGPIRRGVMGQLQLWSGKTPYSLSPNNRCSERCLKTNFLKLTRRKTHWIPVQMSSLKNLEVPERVRVQ